MPDVKVKGIRLFHEIIGDGIPIVFVHEFAGDLSSWDYQLRFFSPRYRVVTFNARGYPPSSVPEDPSCYSQDIATDDLAGLIKALDLSPAHVVGLSMGAYATLHLGLRYPELVRSLVIAGCGYGSDPDDRRSFQQDAQRMANLIETEGMEKFVKEYSAGPTRAQLKRKNPCSYTEFVKKLLTHSPKGLANTQRGVQAVRPSIYDLTEDLKKLKVPTLILAGDEDWPCIRPSLFLKRTVTTAALAILPNSGHTINLEEPTLFNDIIQDFLTQVECGRWPNRDPRASTSIFSEKK